MFFMKTTRIFWISIFTILLQTFINIYSEVDNFDIHRQHTIKLNRIPATNMPFKNNRFRELDHLALTIGNTSPIYGNSSSLNYYYINIGLGTPSKTQAVIIDTGSKLTSIPCLPYCLSCGEHINSYYDMTKSKTSKEKIAKTGNCTNYANSFDGPKYCEFSIV